ncbi:MAG: large conductance mechanosensitive channel protein MscL [Planctomycetia bacterium]|nr:large conductance mechanosensitive channel protein MscL [Planctomycetia bacterium]
MLQDFKAFIAKGNVVDMAIGVVMGSAFTAIVNSMVSDLITPLIGIVLGQIDLSGYTVEFMGATFGVGNFVNAVISFLIISLVLFFIVKGVSALQNAGHRAGADEETEEEPTGSNEEVLLGEIRDLLRQNGTIEANTTDTTPNKKATINR